MQRSIPFVPSSWEFRNNVLDCMNAVMWPSCDISRARTVLQCYLGRKGAALAPRLKRRIFNTGDEAHGQARSRSPIKCNTKRMTV
jgi:hypothetical protein